MARWAVVAIPRCAPEPGLAVEAWAVQPGAEHVVVTNLRYSGMGPTVALTLFGWM